MQEASIERNSRDNLGTNAHLLIGSQSPLDRIICSYYEVSCINALPEDITRYYMPVPPSANHLHKDIQSIGGRQLPNANRVEESLASHNIRRGRQLRSAATPGRCRKRLYPTRYSSIAATTSGRSRAYAGALSSPTLLSTHRHQILADFNNEAMSQRRRGVVEPEFETARSA